jgi:hypothetical protein
MIKFIACHSHAGGNPVWLGRWMPAIVYPRAGGGRNNNFTGGWISANIMLLIYIEKTL